MAGCGGRLGSDIASPEEAGAAVVLAAATGAAAAGAAGVAAGLAAGLAAAFGRHCEYHSSTSKHTVPSAHAVAPVHLRPPHWPQAAALGPSALARACRWIACRAHCSCEPHSLSDRSSVSRPPQRAKAGMLARGKRVL